MALVTMLLVNVLESYLPPLKHISDLSFESGIFPDSLKIAKIAPAYKSGCTSSLSNYKLISVLSCFSKMLERIM